MNTVYMEEIEPLVDYVIEKFRLDQETVFSKDFFAGLIQNEFSHNIEGLRKFFRVHPKLLLSVIKSDIEIKLYSAKLFVGITPILLTEAEERREKWKFEYLLSQVRSLERKIRRHPMTPLVLAA